MAGRHRAKAEQAAGNEGDQVAGGDHGAGLLFQQAMRATVDRSANARLKPIRMRLAGTAAPGAVTRWAVRPCSSPANDGSWRAAPKPGGMPVVPKTGTTPAQSLPRT